MISKTLRMLLAAMCAVSFSLPARADEAFRILQVDGHPVKWGAPRFGTGAVVTWHLASRASQGGTINCRKIAPVAPMLSGSGLSGSAFEHAIDVAFESWQSVAEVRFVRVADDKPANLTIGAEGTPDGTAYTDVTTASRDRSQAGILSLARAVICLNPRVHWTVARQSVGKVLSYVLEHEIGHALGLDHPGPAGELMSFEYSETIQILQPGDIAGIVSLYGTAPRSGAMALNARPIERPQSVR